jgi:hypothetical protein
MVEYKNNPIAGGANATSWANWGLLPTMFGNVVNGLIYQFLWGSYDDINRNGVMIFRNFISSPVDYANNPITKDGDAEWLDRAGSVGTTKNNGLYIAWHKGRNTLDQKVLGVLFSKDFLNWNKYGVILSSAQGQGWDNKATQAGGVIKINGIYYGQYNGLESDWSDPGEGGIWVSKNPISANKYSGNPTIKLRPRWSDHHSIFNSFFRKNGIIKGAFDGSNQLYESQYNFTNPYTFTFCTGLAYFKHMLQKVDSSNGWTFSRYHPLISTWYELEHQSDNNAYWQFVRNGLYIHFHKGKHRYLHDGTADQKWWIHLAVHSNEIMNNPVMAVSDADYQAYGMTKLFHDDFDGTGGFDSNWTVWNERGTAGSSAKDGDSRMVMTITGTTSETWYSARTNTGFTPPTAGNGKLVFEVMFRGGGKNVAGKNADNDAGEPAYHNWEVGWYYDDQNWIGITNRKGGRVQTKVGGTTYILYPDSPTTEANRTRGALIRAEREMIDANTCRFRFYLNGREITSANLPYDTNDSRLTGAMSFFFRNVFEPDSTDDLGDHEIEYVRIFTET